MSKKIYVGNLSYDTTSDDLRRAFSEHGSVTSAEVMVDRQTGRSRGFGFVEMSDGGVDAIKSLDLTELQGRKITVNEARPREERGGNRGSYGRRSY
jgi:RNA recognition motif-containing protein